MLELVRKGRSKSEKQKNDGVAKDVSEEMNPEAAALLLRGAMLRSMVTNDGRDGMVCQSRVSTTGR